VQILVEVANIQMRILKTEVGKGSMLTAIGHGLVDPEGQVKSLQEALLRTPKGNEVNIPQPAYGYSAATQLKSDMPSPALGRVIFSV